MLLKAMDHLLQRSLGRAPDMTRLGGLETDVWARIREEEAQTASNGFLAALTRNSDPARARFAALALALLAGIMVTQITPGKAQAAEDSLGLDVFAPKNAYIVAAIEYEDVTL